MTPTEGQFETSFYPLENRGLGNGLSGNVPCWGEVFPAAVGSFVRQFRMGLQADWYRSLGVLLLPSCLG